MVFDRRSPLAGSVLGVALSAVALLFSVLLRPWLEPDAWLLFIAASFAAAWFSGTGGGISATLASTLLYGYFFLPAGISNTWQVGSFLSLLGLGGVCGLVSFLTVSRRRHRGLLGAYLDGIPIPVFATAASGRVTWLNPAAESLTGWTLREARGKDIARVAPLTAENPGESPGHPLPRLLFQGSGASLAAEALLVARNGSEIPVEYGAAPVRDESGRLAGGIVVCRDIRARRHREEQLSHTRKMDAVERLASGLAGDFNNILTIITGYAQLARAELGGGGAPCRFLDEITLAAGRAASLTGRLIAFGGDNHWQPRPLDLNALLGGLEPELRRMLGPGVKLTLLPGARLGRVFADPPHLERAVLNLAANARDAMPEGGSLVIETSNVDLGDPAASRKIGVPPGQYVMLAVSDTGVGMNEETRARLFEPFFTTKEQGQGGGLGLSMVYGAVRQCEGQITVFSRPGCGSIFEIYLPCLRETAAPAPPVPSAAAPKGSETVLLVDSEEGLRRLLHTVLTHNGYQVIEAAGPAAALDAWEKHAGRIDLLLTDVTLPQMSGIELGKRLREKAPALRVLYMSGHRDSFPPPGADRIPPLLLRKPFTPDMLLARLRQAFDS